MIFFFKLFIEPKLLEHIKRGINPKYEPCISKIERVMAISVSQGKTKSQKLKFFKSRYLAEFLHVIITFIGFKVTFSNMGPKTTPSLISKGGCQISPLGGRE